MRTLPDQARFKAGDVLVVFGELFARGYANGIVDEAERMGLKVIRSTVGRRDAEGKLRVLNAEELASQPQPFINVPLEAGFDMEPCSQDGSTPVDQIKTVKMSEWENAKMDWAKVEDSRRRGTERFRSHVASYMKELDGLIPKGANVIFLHTMAGGVPRAKILMPTMNKVFKGTGDRHLPSERFWQSDLGRFSDMNFEEVTANTFAHLIDLSHGLRERVESEGGSARYLAYGYHGTEVMIRGEYRWQSYAPYLQGWAKNKLEDIAVDAWKKGIKATVFNCPEILTNSSSIFQGVEVPLYPLMGALRRDGGNSKKATQALTRAQALLKPEHSIDEMLALSDQVLSSEPIQRHSIFETWPQHNGNEQMTVLIEASEKLVEMHKDTKELITFVLSEEVFRSTGYVMYHEAWAPRGPVFWLGHDILTKALATDQTL
jgi:hypothetical protein